MIPIQALIVLLASFLTSLVSILTLEFEDQVPWVDDGASFSSDSSFYRWPTDVASPSVVVPPWTDTEIFTNMSTLNWSSLPHKEPSNRILFSLSTSPTISPPISPAVYHGTFPLAHDDNTTPQEPPLAELLWDFWSLLWNLWSLLSGVILRRTTAINGFLAHHSPVHLSKQSVVSFEGCNGFLRRRLPVFRRAVSGRLCRQPKRRHQWAPLPRMDTLSPSSGPASTLDCLACLECQRIIESLSEQIAGLQKDLKARELATEKFEMVAKEFGKVPVAAKPVLPPIIVCLPPVTAYTARKLPLHANIPLSPAAAPLAPPSPVVSCLEATAARHPNPAGSSPTPAVSCSEATALLAISSSPAVSCSEATAAPHHPASSARISKPAVSCPPATAQKLRIPSAAIFSSPAVSSSPATTKPLHFSPATFSPSLAVSCPPATATKLHTGPAAISQNPAVSCPPATATPFRPAPAATSPSPAVSCPPATARPLYITPAAISPNPAVSCPPATAPPLAISSSPAVSCLGATASPFRPARFIAPLAPTAPPAPQFIQPIYGAWYDAAGFQYQQQMMQLERERRAISQRTQWTQAPVLPSDPNQATELFRQRFPNHGKKA